jgi:hypothetical protein
MKEITRHNFKRNGKSIAAYYLNGKARKKAKVPGCDCICLAFEHQDKDGTKIYLRPDEALLVARQMIEAVYSVTNAYEIRLLSVNRETK